jgi:hypothetical protein
MGKILKNLRLTALKRALFYRKKYKEVGGENLMLRRYLADALVKIQLLELREKHAKLTASKPVS